LSSTICQRAPLALGKHPKVRFFNYHVPVAGHEQDPKHGHSGHEQDPKHGHAIALTAELTIEPFVPGQRGPHVEAATRAAREVGVGVEVGPFGDRLEGPDQLVLDALSAALRGAFAAGATRISVQLSATG
ncbi:MAG: hypothetical protein M1115_01090, partial [Actinobacteria bacterium]|nr:hypothetical protein [Actinomycetota bacterium]